MAAVVVVQSSLRAMQSEVEEGEGERVGGKEEEGEEGGK